MSDNDYVRRDDTPSLTPFRLLQIVQVIDIVAGAVLYVIGPGLGDFGEVAGMPVLRFVGVALILIGVVGLIAFTVLARNAVRRWEQEHGQSGNSGSRGTGTVSR
jgi:hypothetical protein